MGVALQPQPPPTHAPLLSRSPGRRIVLPCTLNSLGGASRAGGGSEREYPLQAVQCPSSVFLHVCVCVYVLVTFESAKSTSCYTR